MIITNDLVETFLKCPTKCFLRSGGETREATLILKHFPPFRTQSFAFSPLWLFCNLAENDLFNMFAILQDHPEYTSHIYFSG